MLLAFQPYKRETWARLLLLFLLYVQCHRVRAIHIVERLTVCTCVVLTSCTGKEGIRNYIYGRGQGYPGVLCVNIGR